MRTLPSVLIDQKNTLAGVDAGAWVHLVELNRTDSTYFRFTDNTRDLVFDGKTWTKRSMEIAFPEPDAGGSIVNFKISVSNVDRLITGSIEAGELIGFPGALYKVHSDHLGNPINAIVWRGRILGPDGDDGNLTLSVGPYDPLGSQVPGSRYSRTRCRFKYKSPECAAVSVLTTCDKSLANCIARANKARFGGFPGLPAVRP